MTKKRMCQWKMYNVRSRSAKPSVCRRSPTISRLCLLKSTTPTQSIRQNYTSVYSFACDVVAMPKHRYCVEQPPSMAVYAMLNVPHGMGYPAQMPVVPNRNEFFALQKTRSQKCTRMYIFDEVVAVGFNTLCYDASVGVLNPRTNKISHRRK